MGKPRARKPSPFLSPVSKPHTRAQRHEAIIRLVRERILHNAKEVWQELAKEGYIVGYETVTVDIKTISGLARVRPANGKGRSIFTYTGGTYAADEVAGGSVIERDTVGKEILRSDLNYTGGFAYTVDNTVHLNNNGTGNLYKRGLASWRPRQMVSVIADDDTCIVFCWTAEAAEELAGILNAMLGGMPEGLRKSVESTRRRDD